MAAQFLPLFTAVLASMVFGWVVHIQRKGVSTTDPVAGALISVAAMTAGFWLLLPLFSDLSGFSHPAVFYFVLCGLAFPALGQFFQIQGVGRVGPSLTAAMSSFMPLFAALPAVIFLGERISPQMAVGFLVLMAGLAIAGLMGRRQDRVFPYWALLLPLGAAASRGLVQPVSKAGLDRLPDPYFATLVMCSCSTVVLAMIMTVFGKWRAVRPSETGFWWFGLVGIVNGTGILLVNLSVSTGEVSVVAPLISCSPIWTLFLSQYVFKTEVLTRRHFLMTGMVVAGAVLIVTR